MIFEDFKIMIYFFSENENEVLPVMGHTSLSSGIHNKYYNDPRQMLSEIKDAVPVAIVLDLDSKDEKVIKAILSSLRKIYGQGMAIFGLIRKPTGPMFDYALANKINNVILKDADQQTVKTKIVDVVEKLYRPEKKKKAVKLPGIIDWYYETISPAFAMVCTGIETIDEPEAKLKFYEERLAIFTEPFLTMVKSMSKADDNLHFIQALRLYGFENNRNLLVSLMLADALKLESFGWNEKTGKLNIEPKNFISYALKAYQSFADEGRYAQIAFNCGLAFDLFHQMNENSQTKDAGIKKLIETKFGEALAKAKVGYKKAKAEKDLSLEKQIITYFMMKECGKVMMAMHFKDYADFLAKCEKKPLKNLLFNFAEQAKYSITHEIVGSFLCQMVPEASEASHAVLYSAQPFILNGMKSEHNAMTLAKFCNTF